ncbi:P2R1A-PPP2R2A-interacting phosphatase regulator 1-like isoform X2 [Protopterus annectens]|uniref:P2R1A-PPP2R2A-interacting phosphatase regulator 1-like isoform X2 n=1 Tax=Protopterus annectens TaxID=7888 RepID=UPI001CFB2E95|nr:P2R1A-PPP2R2A-interacting phosphatase regulator 1-like isoform X2 [Protopterus annectens]
MERMEVDQNACATAGGGGTSLRRSNSAPMITNLSDSATILEPVSSKCRRSSVSINLSCPGLVFPVSPFRLSAGRSDSLKQEESMDITHRDNTLTRGMSAAMQSISLWDGTCISPLHIHHSGVTPNPSPSPTRRFGRMNLQSSPLGSLKRKGTLMKHA